MSISSLSRTFTLSLGMVPWAFFGCGGSDVKPTPAPTATAPTATAPSPSTPAAPVASPVDEAWPTEEEVKAVILKVEYDINASETNKAIWKVKDFRHEVKSVKLAQKTTLKQMTYGAPAITVYPVKVLYTQITDYETKEPTRVECGADGVWFLYRDSFGEWKAKYGNE